MNLYRYVEEDSSNLGETVYKEVNNRLPPYKVSALIEGRTEQYGVYQITQRGKVVAVLDFAIPGGIITFEPHGLMAMGLFLDYAAVNREKYTRTFTWSKTPFTWTLYPKLGPTQTIFECVEGSSGGVVAAYSPDKDQPVEGKTRGVFRISEGCETFMLELICALIICRHNMKFYNG